MTSRRIGGKAPVLPRNGARVCSCALLRGLTRRVTQTYDQALRPAGLRVTQYMVLANVDRESGRSVTDLAARLEMDRTTLTRNLRPLEAAGWLRIVAGPDRRSRSVVMTAAGREVLAAARPLWREAEDTFREALGLDQAAQLRELAAEAMASLA